MQLPHLWLKCLLGQVYTMFHEGQPVTYFMRAAALLKQGQWSISTDDNLRGQPHNLHACMQWYMYEW